MNEALKSVLISPRFIRDDRGHILLIHRERDAFAAWITLEGDIRLEILYDASQNPALRLRRVFLTPTELYARLALEFNACWEIRNMDLCHFTAAGLKVEWDKRNSVAAVKMVSPGDTDIEQKETKDAKRLRRYTRKAKRKPKKKTGGKACKPKAEKAKTA